MSTDDDRIALERADTASTVAVRARFTRERMETILAVSAAIATAVLGVQALLVAISSPLLVPPVAAATIPALFLVIGACAAAYSVPIWRVRAALIVLASISVLLAGWPLLSIGVVGVVSPEPWPWYLVNIASTAAVIALPPGFALGATIVLPLLYAIARIAQGVAGPGIEQALLFEVPYPLILGLVIFLVVAVLRRLGARIDAEREATVAAYRRAAHAQAMHEERVVLSALVHDSVLAALIAAERATSPREQSLALSMAREALESLAEPSGQAAPALPDARAQSRNGLARAVQANLIDLGIRAPISVEAVRGEPPIPPSVAAALVGASSQAIANAVEHAGGRGLDVRIGAHPECSDRQAGVEIVVRDTGEGFDPSVVPADRLGISASIKARLAAVGGRTAIITGPGGTTVTLQWAES